MCKTKDGISRLQIRFAENIANALTVIVYAVYRSMLHCDVARNIWW